MSNLPDIYFLQEWGNIYQVHDKGEITVFEYKNDLGHVYYQFLKRNNPILFNGVKYYDIVTTYGFNGPIILAGDLNDKAVLASEFDKAFTNYCIENNIVSEFVRFSPWLKNHLDFEKHYTCTYNNYTLFIDLSVEDFFMEEFHPRVRTKIRKSIKSGVKIEYDFNGDTIDQFHDLYQMMIKKNNVNDYYVFDVELLKRTFQHLKDKQVILNAVYEGKIISSAIILYYGDFLHYHLAANNPKYSNLNANSLIFYEAGLFGKKLSKKQFHLGGAFTEELFAFKKQFTRNGFCDFYVGKKIRNEKIYDKLVDQKTKEGNIINANYFPLYRG